MTILLVSVLLIAAYALGDNSPAYNLTAAGLLALILGCVCGCLALSALCAVWALLFIGLQFLMPMAAGQTVIVGHCSKHFAWAVAVAG